MFKYVRHFFTTPQAVPVPGRDMAKNGAGGYAFELSPWQRLDRFLVLGSEGGTYYASEAKLTVENAQNLLACLAEDGVRVVRTVIEVSETGRAPKNDPAVFALALAVAKGDEATRKAAYDAIHRVCRTGTHLFQFCGAVQALRGWSGGLRRGVSRFYLDRDVEGLAYQLVKYREREGFSHRDVLRLAHTASKDPARNALLRWTTLQHGDALKGVAPSDLREALAAAVAKGRPASAVGELPELVLAYEEVRRLDAGQARRAVELIRGHRLPWEALPTELLAVPEVWEALVPQLPMTALLRNLGRLSALGVLRDDLSDTTRAVVSRLTDAEALRKARVHPFAVLLALSTYGSGRGVKGSLTWTPVQAVKDALEDAFYLAFRQLPKLKARVMVGLDVSGSMDMSKLLGTHLSAREAASALVMARLRSASSCQVVSFQDRLVPLAFSRHAGLQDVIRATKGLPFGRTDCAQPILHALDRRIPVDVFEIYTDNETWCGQVHPFQALRAYRKQMGIPAKLVVVGLTATAFSIADPRDGGMLDVVGFDASAPEVIHRFVEGF